MAHRKTHRKSRRRNSKNIVNKTLNTSVGVVKSTSRKYMPKVKSGLEQVGSRVVKTGTETVPFLQRLTRKLFGAFTKKRR